MSMARNHQIIRNLQTTVESRLTARPGVYDGRKNLFTSFKLGSESETHEVSQSYPRLSQLNILPTFQYLVPMSTGAQVEGAPPPEYTVHLGFAGSINPEYVLLQSIALINV